MGHSDLAERALLPVMPSIEEFPFSLRLNADTLASAGSSSMAAVCGGALALADAGVPLKALVAGGSTRVSFRCPSPPAAGGPPVWCGGALLGPAACACGQPLCASPPAIPSCPKPAQPDPPAPPHRCCPPPPGVSVGLFTEGSWSGEARTLPAVPAGERQPPPPLGRYELLTDLQARDAGCLSLFTLKCHFSMALWPGGHHVVPLHRGDSVLPRLCGSWPRLVAGPPLHTPNQPPTAFTPCLQGIEDQLGDMDLKVAGGCTLLARATHGFYTYGFPAGSHFLPLPRRMPAVPPLLAPAACPRLLPLSCWLLPPSRPLPHLSCGCPPAPPPGRHAHRHHVRAAGCEAARGRAAGGGGGGGAGGGARQGAAAGSHGASGAAGALSVRLLLWRRWPACEWLRWWLLGRGSAAAASHGFQPPPSGPLRPHLPLPRRCACFPCTCRSGPPARPCTAAFRWLSPCWAA